MRKSSYCRSYCNYMEKQVVLSSSDKDKKQKLNDRSLHDGGVAGVGIVISDEADLLSTWRPRLYICSFCKRRFKSAQALGGHMNVHRRARAMLRSQSISPIPSPPTSSIMPPWHPNNSITSTSHHHPLQVTESGHFIPPSPNLSWPTINNPHHTINPSSSYNLSHVPMIGITSSSTLMHKNPLSAAATAYKYTWEQRCDHAEPINAGIRAKKNCIIRADEYKLNGFLSSRNYTRQDDALVRLSLGNGLITSNSTVQEDIDLSLHL